MNESDKPTYRLGSWLVREDWPLWIVLLASIVVGAVVYPSLPERIPTHWGLNGEANGWSGRAGGVFGMVGLNLAVYLILVFIPLVDPRRENYRKFLPTLRVIRAGLVIFMTAIWGAALAAAAGAPVPMDRVVSLLLSLLFILLGNYMTRVRYNWFIGVRTPWSLANEEAWRLTHRVAGPAFVAGGLISLAGAAFGGGIAMLALAVGAGGASVVSFVYSFFAFRKSQTSEATADTDRT